jgi:hypothetical protein
MLQSNRLAALHKFKANQRNILVATDVASRWIFVGVIKITLYRVKMMHAVSLMSFIYIKRCICAYISTSVYWTPLSAGSYVGLYSNYIFRGI